MLHLYTNFEEFDISLARHSQAIIEFKYDTKKNVSMRLMEKETEKIRKKVKTDFINLLHFITLVRSN